MPERSSARALEGRVVLVTGAAGGIGRATALCLAQAGASLALTDLVEGTETREAVIEAGGKAAFFPADISIESEVEGLMAGIVKEFGRLDGAFNNAGVEQVARPIADISKSQWDRAIRIDLTGVFLCMKHEIGQMRIGGRGSIVNAASALAGVAIPAAGEYIAAKAGVLGLTRAAAIDYARQHIRVNAVLPGVINTQMIKRLTDDPNHAAFFDKLRERHPAGRFGRPEEVAEAVTWLLSDAASFVTGASLPVDGGYLAA